MDPWIDIAARRPAAGLRSVDNAVHTVAPSAVFADTAAARLRIARTLRRDICDPSRTSETFLFSEYAGAAALCGCVDVLQTLTFNAARHYFKTSVPLLSSGPIVESLSRPRLSLDTNVASAVVKVGL